jgi:hypothetical protein
MHVSTRLAITSRSVPINKLLYFGTGGDASITYDGTNIVINPKVVSTGFLSLLGDLSIVDQNIILGSSTGTKIGTATSQKLGLWNATPVVQPTTAVTAAEFVANTSGIADNTVYDKQEATCISR